LGERVWRTGTIGEAMFKKLLKHFQGPAPSAAGNPPSRLMAESAPESMPEESSATPVPDAASLLAQGNTALGSGELEEAKRCYRAACEAQPAEPTARLNLGYVLLELGDPQAAIDALQQAIVLRRPEDGFLHEALYLRGR